MACNRCETVLLSEGPTCKVHGCTCGVVQVTSGGMTIRLTAEAFLKIAWTIEEAALKLVEEGGFKTQTDTPQNVH